MLIKCPECDLQVSDKANSCPHCGFPLSQTDNTTFEPTKTQQRAKRKHLRLPNGFGQITRINKQLRNPYRVMVTVGKTDEGKPISKLLKPVAYFPTYNAAYEALVEYNKDPYSLEDDLLMKDLYEKWFEEYKKTLKSSSSERTVRAAWAYCSSVYNIRVRDIRVRHIKGCMSSTESPNMQARIKSVFNLMLDYALEYDLVDKNYARSFNVSDDIAKKVDDEKKEHIAFTNEELEILWNNRHVKYVDTILFQCYSGFRPQELCKLLIKNVDLDKNIIVGGMKTEAGTDRPVPIHPLIKEIVEESIKSSQSEYLFQCLEDDMDKELTYDKYRRRFAKVLEYLKLNPEHRPHDPRKTFVTLAKKYNVDEYAIKRIVGHSIDDLTEKVYTERDIEWLQSEMRKINRDGNKY